MSTGSARVFLRLSFLFQKKPLSHCSWKYRNARLGSRWRFIDIKSNYRAFQHDFHKSVIGKPEVTTSKTLPTKNRILRLSLFESGAQNKNLISPRHAIIDENEKHPIAENSPSYPWSEKLPLVL